MSKLTQLWSFNDIPGGGIELVITPGGHLAFSFFDIHYDIYSDVRWGINKNELIKLKEWAYGYGDQELILSCKGATWGCFGKEDNKSKSYLYFHIKRIKSHGRDDYPAHYLTICLDSMKDPHNIPYDLDINDMDFDIAGIIENIIPYNGSMNDPHTLSSLRCAIDNLLSFIDNGGLV